MRIAKNLYNQVLEINHAHLHTKNNPGILNETLEEHQKVKTYFKKATETNPNYISAHNDLWGLLKKLKENQKTKGFMRKQLKLIIIMCLLICTNFRYEK